MQKCSVLVWRFTVCSLWVHSSLKQACRQPRNRPTEVSYAIGLTQSWQQWDFGFKLQAVVTLQPLLWLWAERVLCTAAWYCGPFLGYLIVYVVLSSSSSSPRFSDWSWPWQTSVPSLSMISTTSPRSSGMLLLLLLLLPWWGWWWWTQWRHSLQQHVTCTAHSSRRWRHTANEKQSPRPADSAVVCCRHSARHLQMSTDVSPRFTHTHTHTHTGRERGKERGNNRREEKFKGESRGDGVAYPGVHFEGYKFN